MISMPSLSRLATPPAPREAECELCASDLPARHNHVVELGERGVKCVCRPCGLLFEHSDSPRFRTVPDRVIAGELAAGTNLAQLGIPVALAFCYVDSIRGNIVCYPGPAGIIDAELEPATWAAIREATPLARRLEHDVEALLLHSPRGAQMVTCFLVPISSTYELSAKLRDSWRGFSGGTEAETALTEHLADLARRAPAR
jgi:hypothetical protein